MKTRYVVIVLAACLIVTAAIGWNMLKPTTSGPAVVVYKSPTCGCCIKWADLLEEAGYEVESINQNADALQTTKKKYGVLRGLESCHTAVVDDRYVIEGHVPIASIRRLLEEKPDVVGLAVPGMPIGSPGMEGPNPVAYDVLAFDEKGSTLYERIMP